MSEPIDLGGPCFQFTVDNLSTVPAAANAGVTFASAGANVDGASVSVLPAVAQELQYLVVMLTIDGTSAEDNSTLADLMIDPAGGTTWQAFIDDLICGTASLGSSGQMTHTYHFPVRVPIGSSLGIRARKNGATANNGRCLIWGYGKPRYEERWWCGDRVETIGAVPATSKGTSHTCGVGAFSSFASVGSVSAKRHGAVQFGFQADGNTLSARGINAEIGMGGAALPGVPKQWMGVTTTEVGTRLASSPHFVDLPVGTQYQIHAQASGAININAAVYGVY